MRIHKFKLGALAGVAAVTALAFIAPAGAQTREVIVGTPGFTNNGGLDIITKAFEAETGIKVTVKMGGMDDRSEVHGSKGVAYADLHHGNAIETYSAGGYDYAVDMLEPDLMRVRELWRDEQALKDHFATPHMAAFLKGLRELRPVSVTVKCHELGPERKMPNAS